MFYILLKNQYLTERAEMKTIKVFSVFLMVFLITFVCHSKDIYIAQIATGSDTGINCSNAHSISWFNTVTNWGNSSSTITPDDTVHFCGVISTTAKVQASGTPGNPITIKFENGARFSKPAWGSGALSASAIHSSRKNFIVIDGGTDGIIECTDNGSPSATSPAGTFGLQQNADAVFVEFCDNCEVKNLTIQNIYQRVPNSNDSNPHGRGIVVTNSSNVQIHGNKISDTFLGINTYASAADKTNLNIYENDISKTSTGIVVALAGAVNYSNIYIYKNKIYDGYVWDGCWNNCTGWHHNDGIHTWGNYAANKLGPIYIYNNEIGGNFGKHTTAHIYVSDYTYPVTMFNNLIHTTVDSPANGYIVLHSYKLGATAHVYNNTIKGAGASTAGGNAVYISNSSGWLVKLQNNILMDCYLGIDDSQGRSTVMSDHNIFSNIGNIGRVSSNWFSTIPAWQNTLGGCPTSDNECNSTTNAPNLDSSFRPTSSSSAAIDRGFALSERFTFDFNFGCRPQGEGWDIGAFEYSASSNTCNAYPRELSTSAETSGNGSTGDDGGGGGGCFIATAAYGSYMSAHVTELRQFRDQYLLTNKPGRLFVNLYYMHSPEIASYITRHESVKLVVRCILTPIVYIVKFPSLILGCLLFLFICNFYKNGTRKLDLRRVIKATKT